MKKSDDNKAIKCDSKAAEVYYNHGKVKVKSGDYIDAIKDFDKIIELEPKAAAEVYYNRGIAKALSGDKEGAVKDLNTAVELGYKSVNH